MAYRWYVLLVLTLVQLCHSMDRSIVSLVLQPIGREFRLSDSQLGLLAGLAYGGAFACAVIPMGLAADRWQRRKLLAAAVGLWSALTAVCGLAVSFPMLLASRAGVGVVESAATPNSMSLLSDYFPPSQRTTAVGVWYMGGGLGTMAALLGGGYFAQHFGWRAGFLAAGLPGLALAILVWTSVAEPVRGGIDAKPTLAAVGSLWARIRLIASQPGLLHCMAAIVLVATTVSGLTAWLVTFLMRAHGLSIGHSGMIVAFSVGLLSALGSSISSILIDRLRPRGGRFSPSVSACAAAVACVLTVLLAACAVLVESTAACVAFLLATGLFLAAYNGPANGLFVTLAPVAVRGLSVSILQFWCNLVGMGVGPLIVGRISDGFAPGTGLRWGLLVILIFNLWGAGLFLVLAGRMRWTGSLPLRNSVAR